jgi:SMI1/KNR4 family protein SUKH-1
MMLVNGLKLPDAFLQLSQAIERGGTHLFLPKEQVDAYGNPFGGDVALYLWTADQAAKGDTDCLAEVYGTDRLSPDEIEVLNDDNDADDPGEIPYLSDFSKIVWLGQDSGNDDPFCFDFRENLQEPSIICYHSWYWRRVAPKFEEFIGLYRPSRFVVREAQAEKTFGSTPNWRSILEKHMCSREALAITEEALSKIRAARGARKP